MRAQSVKLDSIKDYCKLDVWPSTEPLTKQFSIRDSLIKFDDTVYEKGQEWSTKIEESKVKERITAKTTEIIDQSLGLGATIYLKTADTFSSISNNQEV